MLFGTIHCMGWSCTDLGPSRCNSSLWYNFGQDPLLAWPQSKCSYSRYPYRAKSNANLAGFSEADQYEVLGFDSFLVRTLKRLLSAVQRDISLAIRMPVCVWHGPSKKAIFQTLICSPAGSSPKRRKVVADLRAMRLEIKADMIAVSLGYCGLMKVKS